MGGWFCRFRPQILGDGAAIKLQLPRDAALGPAMVGKGDNRLLDAHFELVHYALGESDLRPGRKLPLQSGWF